MCDDTARPSLTRIIAHHVRTSLRVRRDRTRPSPSGSRPASTRPRSSRSSTTARCPRTDLATWDFRVYGEVDSPFTLTWDQFKALPRKTVKTDIHCVTRWTKLDTTWEGVPIQAILEMAGVRPTATHVVSHAEQGYTANLPLTVLDDDDVLLADTFDGKPLELEHGYPLRLFVPKRYFWKSSKWVRGLEFLDHDQLGLLGALRLQQRRRPLEGRALQRVTGRPSSARGRSAGASSESHDDHPRSPTRLLDGGSPLRRPRRTLRPATIRRGRDMKRPFGVTLLAIIFAAAGLTYMMLGFQMTTAVTFGPLPSGQGTWIWGWIIVLTGLAFWAGGLAAWRLQPWGWMLGQILAIFGLVEASSRSSGPGA